MTDVIEKIYDTLISESKTHETSYTTYKDLYEKDEELWDKVRPILSQDIIEELQENQDAILIRSNLEWFRQGIRTGISLMLELL